MLSSEQLNFYANIFPPQMFAVYGIFQYVAKFIAIYFVSVLVQQQSKPVVQSTSLAMHVQWLYTMGNGTHDRM